MMKALLFLLILALINIAECEQASEYEIVQLTEINRIYGNPNQSIRPKERSLKKSKKGDENSIFADDEVLIDIEICNNNTIFEYLETNVIRFGSNETTTPEAGDVMTWRNPVYCDMSLTIVAGTSTGACTRAGTNHWECTVTIYIIEEGQIMMQGLYIDDPGQDSVIAIVGGTGLFRGVMGESLAIFPASISGPSIFEFSLDMDPIKYRP